MTLPELISLIEISWEERFVRGCVLNLRKDAVLLADGSRVHLRVMVQRVQDAPLLPPGPLPPDPSA